MCLVQFAHNGSLFAGDLEKSSTCEALAPEPSVTSGWRSRRLSKLELASAAIITAVAQELIEAVSTQRCSVSEQLGFKFPKLAASMDGEGGKHSIKCHAPD